MHSKFMPHFVEFYAANKHKHDLNLSWHTTHLHKAQGLFVEHARKTGSSHILFVEDDHWGFPIDGLDALLEHDKDVVGFPSYHKTYPYFPLSARKKDKSISFITDIENLEPFVGQGLEQTELISFGFTLVRTSVFDRIQNPFEVHGSNPTDSYFSQYCEDAGIERWLDFRCLIGHGDVDAREIPYLRMAKQMMESGLPPQKAVTKMPESLRQELQKSAGSPRKL